MLSEENKLIEVQDNTPQLEDVTDDTEQFEKRVKKLKVLYDNGILSEEEFLEEKRRIMSEL